MANYIIFQNDLSNRPCIFFSDENSNELEICGANLGNN